MKNLFFFAVVLLFSSTSLFAASLKVEGNCSGNLADGTPVSFQYYSNFDGCKDVSRAAISFQGGIEGMLTGTRSFTEKSDIYKFGKQRLRFANSTGNTTGRYSYNDDKGEPHTVVLQCEVRDYEYGECE